MIRTRLFIAALSLVLISGLVSPATAVKQTSSFHLVQTPAYPDQRVTFHGVIKPRVKNAVVQIDVKLGNQWRDTRLRTKSTPSGAWRISTRATAFEGKASYRARVSIGGKVVTTSTRSIVIEPTPSISNPDELIALTGPGGRIHGTDVSRWQHSGDKPLDFVKMYNAGIRFVIIKASDTRDEADALALKYLLMNRDAAQAAGLYTGYYHYAVLPNTIDRAAVIRDAQAQAQKVIWRLSSLGGYTEKDLPYALDLENNCVASSGTTCTRRAPKALVTLWAETWMETVHERTGRKPIFYSYPTFMEQSMTRSAKLREYPLWKAQYGIDPADPTAEPGRKVFGCFVHSWSTSDCSSLWQIWQYSSCGVGKRYGVASSRIDLNVFRGDPASFLALTRGVWTPQAADLLPVKEPTTLMITSINATSTDRPVRIRVEVKRPSGNPVVTGTVAFRLNGPNPVRVDQTPVRDASGVWSLSLRNLPAGTTEGFVAYVDQTGTHAEIRQNISFTLAQGIEPTPTPTPTPRPTRAPVAVDTCKGQIRN